VIISTSLIFKSQPYQFQCLGRYRLYETMIAPYFNACQTIDAGFWVSLTGDLSGSHLVLILVR